MRRILLCGAGARYRRAPAGRAPRRWDAWPHAKIAVVYCDKKGAWHENSLFRRAGRLDRLS